MTQSLRDYICSRLDEIKRWHLEDGETLGDITRRLNVSHFTLTRHLRAVWPSRKRDLRRYQADAAVRLFEERDMTWQEAAAELGITQPTMRARLREFYPDYLGRHQNIRQRELDRSTVARMRSVGRSLNDIAVHFDVSRPTVRRFMNREGID
jgi:AraC-like DNA-binding protein